MHILLISRCPPFPLYLGDRLIVFHLARELARRGHVIDLIAFSDRFEDIADRANYADLFRHVTIVADPPRTQFDYALRLLVPGARFPRRAERAWSPAMWSAIHQHVAANTYDLVHCFGGVQVYEYWHAFAPLPAIITPYESYSLYLRRLINNSASVGAQRGNRRVAPAPQLNHLKLRLQWRIARSFESWMFAPYRRVVVVSDRDRDELRALNPALPLEVIPNGVDLDAFQPTDTAREPNTLLFTGNYEYAPNVDAALRLARDIFPQVQASVPSAKLWIVGNAPPPELQALSSEAIIVTGRVPDVRDYLRRASVFVCPLRLGAGIKNKVLEAFALGCPVVATSLSLDGIASRDGEEVLSRDTDEGIVAAVVQLLNDAALRHRLSENGRNLVETRYSWEQVAERYEALYAEAAR